MMNPIAWFKSKFTKKIATKAAVLPKAPPITSPASSMFYRPGGRPALAPNRAYEPYAHPPAPAPQQSSGPDLIDYLIMDSLLHSHSRSSSDSESIYSSTPDPIVSGSGGEFGGGGATSSWDSSSSDTSSSCSSSDYSSSSSDSSCSYDSGSSSGSDY